MFYSVHVAACGFYFIALQYGLGDNTWIGRRFGDVSSISLPERSALGPCFVRQHAGSH